MRSDACPIFYCRWVVNIQLLIIIIFLKVKQKLFPTHLFFLHNIVQIHIVLLADSLKQVNYVYIHSVRLKNVPNDAHSLNCNH